MARLSQHIIFFELQHIIFFKKILCCASAWLTTHSNLWSHYNLYVAGQHGVLCELLKVRGEDLSRYSNKIIQSVGSNKYHHLTRKVMPQTLSSLRQCPQATSVVHSKLDYCNSVYYNLPKSQITRLQQIQNSLACAVVKTAKSCHITPILRSLHWLKITERIEYKLPSLTYKVLTTNQPLHLHNLISVQVSTSSQHSLFISCYPRSTTNIILVTYN